MPDSLKRIILFDAIRTKAYEKKLFTKGLSSLLLMMQAGLAVYKLSKTFKKKKIIVIAGPGNNGGDALAFSFYSIINNENIRIYSLCKNTNDPMRVNNFLKRLVITDLPFIFSHKPLVKKTLSNKIGS